MNLTDIPAAWAVPVGLKSLYCSSLPGSLPTNKISIGALFPCMELSGSPFPPRACFSSDIKWLQNSNICMKLCTCGGAFGGYFSRGIGFDCPGRCVLRNLDPLLSCISSQRIASRAELRSRFRSSSSCKTKKNHLIDHKINFIVHIFWGYNLRRTSKINP